MMQLWRREMHVPLEETKAGAIISVILSLVSMSVLSVCFCMASFKVVLL